MITAICPGSFDPVTIGHLDIISRASKIFDKVIVAVLHNPRKSAVFTDAERVLMLKNVVKDLENVEVVCYNGLLADLAEEKGAKVIVKGLRAVSDFEYEFQMALTNRTLNEDLDTLFLTSSYKLMYLSSSVVKEVGGFGGDISHFIPEQILPDVKNKIEEFRKKR